ncbi:hypothetical protein [Solemya velum gill symbiont]|uniref:hypothetical protein n=1 Tax=Solemya velum gill symbiont TaxID=2340 RepID=UPI0015C36E8B|nr:hypothetical protein [Solemya velum gill symbiont]
MKQQGNNSKTAQQQQSKPLENPFPRLEAALKERGFTVNELPPLKESQVTFIPKRKRKD